MGRATSPASPAGRYAKEEGISSGLNESLVALADASEVMLGDVAQVGVDRSNAATVKLSGDQVNLFETDGSAIRVRTWNDIRLRHDVSAAVEG